jgi:hypothetical protein
MNIDGPRVVAEGAEAMSANPKHGAADDDELEAAVNEAIAACDGDLRATINALIIANNFLESEVGELMKARKPMPADDSTLIRVEGY